MRERNYIVIFMAVVLVLGIYQIAFASGGNHHYIRINDRDTQFDGNRFALYVTNDGSFGYDIPAGASGGEYPKGSGKFVLYAGGLWVGGLVNDEIRTTISEYSFEYAPGPWSGIWETVDDYPDKDYYKVFKISRTDIEEGPGNANYDDWMWGREQALANDDPKAAPPVDSLGQPLLVGDQTLWCIYNDGSIEDHNNMGTAPLGLEVEQTVFGFDREGPLGSVVFVEFIFRNAGTDTIKNTYVSVWADPDVGGASDDLVGCDTDLSLGFAYNATNNDNVYGAQVPAMGYDFFLGPIGSDGIPLPMTSFNKYINGTDPESPEHTYNYMMGLNRDGSDLIDPITGQVTKYFCPGDPVKGTGWNDSDPSDRRYMCNSGPFTFAPGDEQKVVVAVIAAQAGSNMGSVSLLKYYDTQAQVVFNNDFNVPSPPKNPVVEAIPMDSKVLLKWDNLSENYPLEADNANAYAFEGYVVYQGASASGPWTEVETFDIQGNFLTQLWDKAFDEELEVLVEKPLIFGSDEGLAYSILIDEDKVNVGQKLYNGTPYYYAVTAYSYSPTEDVRILESSKQVITVIPQKAVAGNEYMEGSDYEETVATRYKLDDTLPSPDNDQVRIEVVDPTALTGKQYVVYYTPVDTLPGGVYPTAPNADGTEYHYTWSVATLKDGVDPSTFDTREDLMNAIDEVKLENQWNKDGNDRYLIVDGLKIVVEGFYVPDWLDPAPNDWWIDSGDGEDLNRGISWMGAFGGSHFYGGAFWGYNFFGSTLNPDDNPDQFCTVQIVWKNKITLDPDTRKAVLDGEPAGQFVYRYDRPGYNMTGFLQQPFEVWKVVAGERVQQLNFCFVEYVDSGVYDGLWMPPSYDYVDPNGEELGGREYAFIMASEYDPDGGVYDSDANWGPAADVLYAGTFAHRGTHIIDPGDAFQFTWAVAASENDYYAFQAPAPPMIDSNTLIEENLDKVLVVPNPYYGTSTYEMNQFNRVVKFTNMPKTATVRIFNLAGDMVRTLEKDDDLAILEWDMKTSKNYPVASGIYIYHITAYEPHTTNEVATHVGKMAIFVEVERLNEY